MTFLNERGAVFKAWYLLRTYVLTLRVFDVFLQGSLLIVILLETNVFLLIRRDHSGGVTPAFVEDWVIVSAAIAEFMLGTFVAWWGAGKRNFALSVWLALAAASAALVLIVPFTGARSPRVDLCGGEPLTSYSEGLETGNENISLRLAFLIISAIVCVFTKISIWSHGLTYLDDHNPQNGPYFYGILISIRLSLGLSGQNWLQATSLSEDWWQSHLSLCCLTFMFSILFTLFPSQMKDFQWEDERILSTDFVPSVTRVVRNRALVLQTIALSMLSIAVFCYVQYERAYVQATFHIEAYRQDPRTSRTLTDIFRSLVIIFFVMIFRIRFSVCRSDGVKSSTASRVGGILAVVVGVFLVAIAALSCGTGVVEGVGDQYMQPQCSHHCGCDSARYGFSPVCNLETASTFFSPCHAGCGDYEDFNGFLVFRNCSCGIQSSVRGACSINDCRTAFGAYQVLYAVVLAVAASSLLMQGMAVLRAVARVDKTVAVGASFSVVALLTFVAGHLFYMLISNLTCVYSEDGVCLLHRTSLWTMVATSSVMAVGAGALSILASRAKGRYEQTTEL